MTGKIVAFTGSHGTGKSTAVFQTAAEYKLNHPSQTVGVILEQASLCPYPINRYSTIASQLWIFSSQIQAELNAINHYDIVIADRTCVDAIAYTKEMGFESLASAMLIMAKHHIHNYKRIILRTIENNPFCFDDGVRDSADIEFRHNIEQNLIELYSKLGVGVEYL